MEHKKMRVGVVMGGPSSEHEVSLKTGRNVLRYLDKAKYSARPILISRRGKWPVSADKIKKEFDILFLALHGEYGEDGEIQLFLDKQKIRYTGSGYGASKRGMDKIFSSRVFARNGLRVPEFVTARNKVAGIKKEKYFIQAEKRLSFPIVVKPADRGSSVGVVIARDKRELRSAFSHASKYSNIILMQKYISGRELTCGVLEMNRKEKSLLPTEIMPNAKHSFFSYTAKYAKGASREVTPPHLPRKIIKSLQKTALVAHRAIGASGYSRTDMIIDDAMNIYVLEINTLPGLTSTSLLPQEARAAGIDFTTLLDYIIISAFK